MSTQGVKITKSRNFDRNLDSGAMVKQIKKNMWASEEVLFDASNNIAPIAEEHGGTLRSDTTLVRQSAFVTRSWNVAYANVRYTKNYKNPQTKYWVKKGEKKTRSKRSKMMREGVIA